MSNFIKILLKLIISLVAFTGVAVFNGMQEREGSADRIPLAILCVFLFVLWKYFLKTQKNNL